MSTHRESNFARAVGEDMVRTPDGSGRSARQPEPVEAPKSEESTTPPRIGWFEPETQEPWG
jgi:hypothetical protein